MLKSLTSKIKSWFIPAEENEYQPKILRGKSSRNMAVSIIVLELLVILLVLPITPVYFANVNFLSAIFASVLVEKTNDSRLEIGQGTLNTNNLLEQAAKLKAEDMAAKGYFAHYSPDGKSPWYFINEVGYKYKNAGENLAVNFTDSSDVHNAWMQSPTHRANILRGDFKEIGIAMAEGTYKGRPAVFVVQYFGDPLSVVTQSPVVTESPTAPVSEAEVISEREVEEAPTVVLGASDENVAGESTENTKPSWWQKIIASPVQSFSYFLSGFSAFILLCLILKILIKMRIQIPSLILNGVLILILVLGFIYFNDSLQSLYSEIL